MNTIRLHLAWEGVEAEKGVYNYSYIEKVREIVRKCNRFGIWVVIDAHQDLFSRQFCGEGFPTWTAQRKNFPHPLKVNITVGPDGFPNREDCLKIPFS
jgi:endoglycosylceramidase